MLTYRPRWVAALASLLLSTVATGISAQEEETAIPGVPLGFVYESERIPPIAIPPITGTEWAPQVQGILARDLDYSDRFFVMRSLPDGLQGEGVQYLLWDEFGADWLLTGNIENSAGGAVLDIELHDIVFGSVQARGRFPLPTPGEPGFRMAVHRVSDAVVEWATGDPGMAASRITFAMKPFGNPDSQELYIVDSDGEGLQRLTWDDDLAISPAWSPGGDRIAYTSYKSDLPKIYELDLVTGQERVVDADGAGTNFFPAYHPDGDRIAFTVMGTEADGIYSYDLERDCCRSRLPGAHDRDFTPTYSHDGEQIAFLSNRFGITTPQILTMPSSGGEADLVSPYRFGQGGYFADPDWSPVSSKIAFVGGIVDKRVYNEYDIFVADTETGDNRLVQLTSEGNNEDPSWAPDGRHIVFKAERSVGHGIFILDTATGRTRTLVANVDAKDTDWSPLLAGDWVAGGVRRGAPARRR